MLPSNRVINIDTEVDFLLAELIIKKRFMSIKNIKKILSITPISHIKNVEKELKKIGKLEILNDPNENDVIKKIPKFDAIFTNPNKSKVFIGKINHG